MSPGSKDRLDTVRNGQSRVDESAMHASEYHASRRPLCQPRRLPPHDGARVWPAARDWRLEGHLDKALVVVGDPPIVHAVSGVADARTGVACSLEDEDRHLDGAGRDVRRSASRAAAAVAGLLSMVLFLDGVDLGIGRCVRVSSRLGVLL